ncbi:hypothetical protein BHF71_09190 [Vulcanibacillus modesticaldus]|uniref:Metallo-beta-lactamase domain-containing protein n=1 Tax=Vulcanibacillus modesticaldus TaxID=337097 RepID=A0A1D2YUD0_9BACI|nr:MBL fold metallo-hydrolase [Vulcanibacillus modesticaldus]OEF99287.1 hypothetical protein BHF71_09190 [Vulcanibacillus modesticaldus]
MEIKRFVLGEFAVNSYLLIKNQTGVLIDVGFSPKMIEEYIEKEKIRLKAILLTHTHLDHIGGVEGIREKFDVPVYVHTDENKWLSDPALNGSEHFPFYGKVIVNPADNLIGYDSEIKIADFKIKAIHTPGHTPGGITYYIKPYLFSGDTLFENSIGRTDLYGGDFDQLLNSIKEKLFVLPDDTIVFPGHGNETSIGKEKNSNPFI